MLEKSLADRLSIVIPAYNEAAGLSITIEALLRDCPGTEIIVVDDASQDATAAQATRFPGVRLVRHRYNRGQGGALKTGMRQASRPYVAWFDADNEHRTEDLSRLVEHVIAQDLVAVIGQRTDGSASLLRGAGKALIRMIGRQLKIRAGSDLNCGLRVFRREIILGYLPIVPNRFSASLMTTLILLERGYPIAFMPVTTNERVGSSSVRLRDGFDAILILLRAIMLFAPIRVFLPMGFWLVAIGVVYGAVIAFAAGAGFPVAGLLLIVVGLLSMMLGLVADQISQMRLSQLPENVILRKENNSDEPSS
jgi:glycosyltransferase involved in cell wall biosynthesis